jgi:hypothetical protein
MGIKMKRSAVAGKVPTNADLELGELGVNTRDGKLFLKKNVSGAESIVEVGPVVSVAGKSGAVTLAKADVGLGNVDNTSDASKPISSATQTALNGKANTSHGHAIADVSGLQGALDAKLSSAQALGQHAIWVPAVAMYGRLTNGAAGNAVEMGTHRVVLRTLDFDTSVQEFAQFAIQLPKSWDRGQLVCQFVWSHAAASGSFGVVWQIQAVALGDNEGADQAFGTAVTVADTGGTTNNVYITPETGGMTVGSSPGEEHWVVFQVARAPANASDNLPVDARLHGVKIHYTTNALTDD